VQANICGGLYSLWAKVRSTSKTDSVHLYAGQRIVSAFVKTTDGGAFEPFDFDLYPRWVEVTFACNQSLVESRKRTPSFKAVCARGAERKGYAVIVRTKNEIRAARAARGGFPPDLERLV
jgi:hypothetical protein